MTDKVGLEEKAEEVFKRVEPVEEAGPVQRHLVLQRGIKVEAEVDEAGYGHTYLVDPESGMRIDISRVTKGVKVESMVGDVTVVTLTLTAVPSKVEALGKVFVADQGTDQVSDFDPG